MAKKKNVETENNTMDFLGALRQDLTKQGMNFSEYASKSLKHNTGFDVLDAILASDTSNFGFQLRTFNLTHGKSGTGKSTLLTQIAANFIKNNEGQLIYFDAEHSMTLERLANLGCDMSRTLHINVDTSIENYHKMILSIKNLREKQIDDLGEDYVFNNPIVIILDSINGMHNEVELAAGTETQKFIGKAALMWSAILKQHCDMFVKYNITVLAIMQNRDNIAMGPTPAPKDLFYGKMNEKFSGGQALRYHAFYFFSMNPKKNVDEIFGDQALEVELKMIKSKTSVANKPVNLVFFPGRGYSNFHTNYKFMIDNNIIQSKGSYKCLPGYEKNFYAKDVETLYNTDENFRKIFDQSAVDAYKNFVGTVEKFSGESEGSEINFLDGSNVDPETGEIL